MSNNNNTPLIISVVSIIAIVGGILAFNLNNKPQPNSSNNSANQASAMTDNKTDKTSVMVGGAAMFRDKDIVSNVVNAPNLSTLVAAVKAAGLVETLQGPGPFTVFGPNNDAFAALPAGTVETLVKPENKAKLATVLTYHVVSGNLLASTLKDGQTLKTVQGGMLTVTKSGDKILLKDENGGLSTITQADVLQSNGVAHVIDTVLLPKM